MARTQYYNYQAPDSTSLLNNRLRGILQAGVYLGYNAKAGTSGLAITLEMDADPDNIGLHLSKLITHDGLVVAENADLIDIATGIAGDASLPRIDALVGTYVYNASLPNNEITYEVVEGTAAANPSLPTLSDDQVLIAEIHMPVLTGIMLDSYLIDVNRKNLFGSDAFDFEGILRSGVYTGFEVEKGTSKDKVTLRGGTLLTKEYKRIVEVADQVDLFPVAPTSGSQYIRWDAIICLHKYENVESNSPEFILVPGVVVQESLGTGSAEVPDEVAINAAALAHDPKYTSSNYWTILGYIRSGGTSNIHVEYYSTARLLPDTPSFYVRGRSVLPGLHSAINTPYPWEFDGPSGLIAVLNLVKGLNQLFWTNTDVNTYDKEMGYPPSVSGYTQRRPIKIFCEGEFHFGPTQVLGIPEWCEIEGLSYCRFLMANETWPHIIIGGFVSDPQVTVPTFGPTQGVDQTGVPSGYARYEFDVTGSVASEFDTIPGGLTSGGFAGYVNASSIYNGCGITVIDNLGNVRNFWYEERDTIIVVNSDWTFSACGDDGGVAFTIASQVIIWKRATGLKNIVIRHDNGIDPTRPGGISFKGAIRGEIDKVGTPAVYATPANSICHIGKLEIDGAGWFTDRTDTSSLFATNGRNYFCAPGNNIYDDLIFRPNGTSCDITLGAAGTIQEQGAHVGRIFIDGGDNYPSTITLILSYDTAYIGAIFARKVTNQPLLQLNKCFIGVCRFEESFELTAASTICISGDDNFFCQFDLNDPTETANVSLQGTNNYFGRFGLDSSDMVALSDVNNFDVGALSRIFDETNNIGITSDGVVSWNLTTQRVSTSDTTTIFRPYSAGNTDIPAFDLVLNDNEAVRVLLGRGPFEDSSLIATKLTTTTMVEERSKDSFYICWRIGDRVYFRDGTVVEDGQSLQLGTSPPPDNSVTRDKMTDSAWDFVGEFADDCVVTSPVEDFPNEVVFFNDGLVSISISGLNGWGTFVSSVDLSDVKAGDTLLANADYVTPRYPRRMRIEEVDDVGDRVRFDRSFWTGGVGATNKWHWAIVRGNVAFRNDDLDSFSWDEATGVVTFPSSTRFPAASNGYLFRDGAGNKFRINSITNNTLTLEIGVVRVDTTVNDELDGSIETNNNPRNLQLNDLKSAHGFEEITYSGEFYTPTKMAANRNGDYYSYSEMKGDRRVALLADDYGQALFQIDADSPYEVGRNSQLMSPRYIIESSEYVEVTFVGTGLAIGSAGSFGGSNNFMEIDGREYSQAYTPDGGPSGARRVFRPQSQLWCTRDITNMPYGIHTVRLSAAQGSHRFVIFTQPLEDHTKFIDAPGRYWSAAKFYDHPLSEISDIPAVGVRGGSLIRYIPDSDKMSKAWATSSLPVHSTTAQTNGTTTVSNVTNLGDLEVGDLILLDDGGSNQELHVIASVTPPSTVGTVTAVGFSAAISLDFRGKTFLRVTGFVSANRRTRFLFDSSIEEVEETYSVGDFSDSSPVNTNMDVWPDPKGIIASYQGGHEAWDEVAFYGGANAASDATNEAHVNGLVFDWWSGGGTVRIGFVGTGIALLNMMEPTQALANATIDGALIYFGTFTLDGQETGNWTYVCNQLNYGYHILEIDACYASLIRVFRPKTPDVDGFPLMRTSKLADYVVERDQVPNDVVNLPEGVIQRSPGNVWVSSGDNFNLEYDSSGVKSRGGQTNITNDTNNTDTIRFWFWGRRITVIAAPTSTTAVAADVTIMNGKNIFSTPGASIWPLVTGVDTWNIASSNLDVVHRETWDFGFVGLHCLQINSWRNSVGTAGMALIGYEVESPYHTSDRFRLSAHMNNALTINQSFNDLRVTKPRRGTIESYGFNKVDEIGYWVAGVGDSMWLSFDVPSRGGYYKIDFQVYIYSVSADTEFFAHLVRVLGPTTGTGQGTQLRAADDDYIIKFNSVVYLPPGRFPVIVELHSTSAATIGLDNASISVQEIRLLEEDSYENIRGPHRPRSIE